MFQNQPAILRDDASGREILGSGGFGHGLCSPDSNWLTLVEHDRVRLFHYPALELAWEAPLVLGAITPPPVAFSPDSRMLAVSHQRTDVLLRDVASGRVLAAFSPPNPSQITGAHGIEFSQDGRWLMIARDGGDVVGWDLEAVKTRLARLNLGWDAPTAIAAAPVLSHAPPATADDTPQPWSAIETAIFVTTVATLLGGLFVFAIQRRLLRSYEHAESIASEQRRRLGSAQAELLHGQKMRALGTLAAGIAHDFNNLLSVIRLSNQLAAEQTQPTGVAKENVDAIDSAVSQGENIVQSMLGYSRATAEKESVYAVDDAVNETVAMLGRKFLAGIILKLEIAEHLPAVRGSRSRLEQVMLNLIVNASEAMSGQGTLLVTVRATADTSGCVLAPRESRSYIEVTVGDSGPGIPPEVLSRIFEPFFTTKTLGTRPGTGLGLATVYTMAEQDGLGLAVSTAGGVGTTFRIFVAADADTGSADS